MDAKTATILEAIKRQLRICELMPDAEFVYSTGEIRVKLKGKSLYYRLDADFEMRQFKEDLQEYFDEQARKDADV